VVIGTVILLGIFAAGMVAGAGLLIVLCCIQVAGRGSRQD